MKKLMNKSIFLMSIVITVVLFACTKEQYISDLEPEPNPGPIEEPNTNNNVPDPTFEVESYSVAQVTDDQGNQVYQVSFQFLGASDNISFWSGQFGNDYQYRDGNGRIVDYEAINLSFRSRFTTNPGQPDQLSIHVSTDFNGVYTFENVSNAAWTDITQDFNLGITNNSWRESGDQDIREYREGGKPLYVAFKYTYRPPPALAARIWRVREITLTGTTVLGTSTISDYAHTDWSFVDNGLDLPGRSTIEGPGGSTNPSGIMLANGNNGSNADKPMEAWAVSKAFDLDAINYGADKGIFIKRIVDPQLTAHQYNYTEPGTYEVVFVASNIDGDEKKEVVRMVEVTIP